MVKNIESQQTEILPSIEEVWDKIAKLMEDKEYRNMISQAFLSLADFAKASQKKTISSWAKDAIKTIYDLVRK